MSGEIKTSYILEMNSPDEFHPKYGNFPDFRIERMEIKCPEFNKFLHTIVGYDYLWGGRTNWGKDEWYKYVNRDEMETWVAYLSGTPAGYFELEKRSEGDVCILAFGLLPQFIGKGFGGHLLSKAVERAWEMKANKVIVGTCSHDHPHALKNYLARGFHIRETKQSPANPPVESFWELILERVDGNIPALSTTDLCVIRLGEGKGISIELAKILDEIDTTSISFFTVPPERPTELHYHDYDEYWLFTEGSTTVTLRLPDGTNKEYMIGSYDLIVTPKGVEHAHIPNETVKGFQFVGKIKQGARHGHLYR